MRIVNATESIPTKVLRGSAAPEAPTTRRSRARGYANDGPSGTSSDWVILGVVPEKIAEGGISAPFSCWLRGLIAVPGTGGRTLVGSLCF